MSFVLEHRPHTRYGHQPMVFRREFEFEEETYLLEFEEGGYNFVLDEPLPVEVLEGRIRGKVKEPIAEHLPRYDREQEAYVMPDGEWVYVDRFGNMTPRIKPFDFDTPLEGPTLDPDLEPAVGEQETSPTDESSASGEPSATSTATPPAAIPINTSNIPVAPNPASP